jgi:hypothetical protein
MKTCQLASRLLFGLAFFLTITQAPAVNIALEGTGLLGVNDINTFSDAGIPLFHAGGELAIRDNNFASRVDTFGNGATQLSFVGISWASPRTDYVKTLTLTMAMFGDGGWFGPNGTVPPGGTLTLSFLAEPIVQVTFNGGVNWTTIASTSNYLAQFTSWPIGGPSSRDFTITLTNSVTGINGIRIIGFNGGNADGTGFIGVFELVVEADPLADIEPDGMDDTWEAAKGLLVGTDDAAGNPDLDGLTNVEEFARGTNPQVADSDGDGLNDGAEVNTHFSSPQVTDTDQDGLNDKAEVDLAANPLVGDTDGDTLPDGHEVNTLLTSPTSVDSDGDGFRDNIEVARGTNPALATSKPANIAFGGTGIIGTNDAVDSDGGTPHANAGGPASINDGNPASRVDTYNFPGTDPVSFVGITWAAPWPHDVVRLEFTMATFNDGGWFGFNNSGPGPGGLLGPAYLVEPTVQVTTDGTTWTTVPATSDYLTVFNGHQIAVGAPTSNTAIFTLNTPASGLRGIRLIGQEGGTASNGFIGTFELAAKDTESLGDIDADGLTNADETNIYGTNPNIADTDGDGLKDGQEVLTTLTNPLLADSDSDQFNDSVEVAVGTNPNSGASVPPNQSRVIGATGIIGTNDAIDSDDGTTVANAGPASNLIDGLRDLVSRVDTYNFPGTDLFSFVGVKWATPRTTPITTIRFTMCTYFDGGWFGPSNFGGGANTLLNAGHLIEPTVQVTTDGTNWTTVSAVSDYVTVFTNHPLPTVDFGDPTQNTATFMLGRAQTGIRGIRLIGPEGGTASGGFLGSFEFEALTGGPVGDSDADGLVDTWELDHFPSLITTSAADDPDFDGLINLTEYAFGFDPKVPNPGLTAVLEGNQLSVTIAKKPFVQYRVESAGQPDNASFNTFDTTILINDPTTLKVLDNFSTEFASKRFIRVQVTGP